MIELEELPISKITVVDGWNPRTYIDPDELTALTASIQSEGMLNPIVVDRDATAGTYTLVDGHRRIAAAELAGVGVVPCIIRNTGASDELIAAAVLNMRREALRPIDQANTYRRLIANGHSETSIGQALGIPVQSIRDRLRLLRLSPTIQESVNRREIPLNVVPVLETVAAASPELADQIVDVVIQDDSDWDVQDIAGNRFYQLVNEATTGKRKKSGAFAEPVGWHQLANLAKKLKGTAVETAIADAIETLGNYQSVTLNQYDVDAAIAYGCYIERSGPGGDGWITDREFFADRIAQAIDRKIDDEAKRKEALAATIAARHAELDAGDDEEAAEQAAERARQAAEELKAKTASRIQNEALGAYLYTTLHENVPTPDVALEAVKIIASIALSDHHDIGFAAAITRPSGALTEYNRDAIAAAGRAAVNDILAATNVNAVLGRVVEYIVPLLAADAGAVGHRFQGEITYTLSESGDDHDAAGRLRVIVDGIDLERQAPEAYRRAITTIGRIAGDGSDE